MEDGSTKILLTVTSALSHDAAMLPFGVCARKDMGPLLITVGQKIASPHCFVFV